MTEFEQRFRELLKAPYPSVFTPAGVPVFCPRPLDERQRDKYDLDDRSVVDFYTLKAFGYLLLGYGGCEGLYRTIDSLLLEVFGSEDRVAVLDLGCGVGRTVYDCAPRLPRALFVGMDYSYAMCDRAREILIAGEPIQVRAVRDRGFPEFVLAAAKRLENVVIAQGSALDLPFRKHAFDCVLATSLLDRAGDPVRAISEIASALRPGGVLILSTPMNFERAGLWSQLACHEDLYRSVRNAGIEIDTSFTELLNRERRDAAGNIEEWNMVVVRGKLTC